MTDTKWRIGKSFAKYAKIARTPLDPKRLPVVIGGVPCGSILPEDAELLAGTVPELRLEDGCLVLGDAGTREEERSEILARAAAALRAAGRLSSWRDELLDVRASWNSPRLAVMERGAFRALGFWTLAVHLNGITPDGRIWTAQRSLSKAINPGRWDNLAAGMVKAGENPLEAICREAKEEAGLAPEDGRPLPCVRFWSSHSAGGNGWLREATFCFACELREGFSPRNEDGEVQDVRLLSADEMAELIARGLVTNEAALTALFWLAKKTGKALKPEGFYKPLELH